ncbi:MAG: hypothetical protein KC877_04800 [Candidatus Kaiserbacteria bacterium]|nr:hypothetical protein [Candidatus Kaiserbacteria bacterium]MCB9816865.1 hypothetical protein [Candidatus Nomurabacteria bacterium]
MLAIDPNFLEFLDRLQSGDKIAWHSSLRYLYCFDASFDGNWNNVCHSHFYGMYELLRHTYDEKVHILGICFHAADAQLQKHHQLLTEFAETGQLPITSLLDDAVAFRQQSQELSVAEQTNLVLMRDLCVQNDLYLDSDLISQMIPTARLQ